MSLIGRLRKWGKVLPIKDQLVEVMEDFKATPAKAIQGVFRSGLLPCDLLQEWMHNTCRRSLLQIEGKSGCYQWELWASSWLSGADQTEVSADNAVELTWDDTLIWAEGGPWGDARAYARATSMIASLAAAIAASGAARWAVEGVTTVEAGSLTRGALEAHEALETVWALAFDRKVQVFLEDLRNFEGVREEEHKRQYQEMQEIINGL